MLCTMHTSQHMFLLGGKGVHKPSLFPLLSFSLSSFFHSTTREPEHCISFRRQPQLRRRRDDTDHSLQTPFEHTTPGKNHVSRANLSLHVHPQHDEDNLVSAVEIREMVFHGEDRRQHSRSLS